MRIDRLILLTAIAFAPLGCATPPHSNTLLFATNTLVALDVSANATSAAPNITLGYKRQEMAWVPLLANASGPGRERQPATCPTESPYPCVFVGREGNSIDAYSVLATFAGDTAASGSGGTGNASTNARGSIAQFFATGIAARILAERGGAQLVNSGSASPPAAEIIASVQATERNDEQKLNDYFARAGADTFPSRLATLVDGMPATDAGTAGNLKQQPDLPSLLNYARSNLLTHRLAQAIPIAAAPAAATPTPAPAPAPVPAPDSPATTPTPR
jgi:hypothetical protein